MTASSADQPSADRVPAGRQKLPLWRLVAGFAMLAVLAVLLVIAGLVYLDNFRLDRYMRAVAAAPESVGRPDGYLKGQIVGFAHASGLPVQAGDVSISRVNGRPQIRIARYAVETAIGHMDLRMAEAKSR